MAPPSSTSRLVQLARTISDSVSKIDDVLSSQGLPPLSFDEDVPVGYLPDEISHARDMVIDATAELHDLLLEPLHLIKTHSGNNNSVCLQAIARFGMAGMVPPGGHTSFAEMGKQTGLGEQMITRLLRHAMTMRIFREPEPGMIAHTRASRMLTSSKMTAWLRIGTEDMWPAAVKMLDALQKWPQSQEPNETGFALSQNSAQTIYEMIGSSLEKSARFAEAMAVWAVRPDYSPSHATNGYDWASLTRILDRPRIRVVDVGGASGYVAAALALRFPDVDVLVQDMDAVVQGAEAGIPGDLVRDGRVRFQAHDLFEIQGAEGDVFFFRWVLHNWGDRHCVAILRATVPALRPGARVVVMEVCMPDFGDEESEAVLGRVPMWREKDLRSEDLDMGALFNAKERTLREWRALFAEADSRFVLTSVRRPEGSALAVMEVVWTPPSPGANEESGLD